MWFCLGHCGVHVRDQVEVLDTVEDPARPVREKVDLAHRAQRDAAFLGESRQVFLRKDEEVLEAEEVHLLEGGEDHLVVPL